MILRGRKVILRPLKLSDAPRIVKWMADPSVRKFLSMGRVTLQMERKWIRETNKDKNEKGFAINTLDEKYIGNVGLHLNPKNKNASFGIFIGDKRYWNSGYGTDAMRTILKYGFEKLELHKISLNVYAHNQRAINLYLDMGFKLAGIKKEDRYRNDKFYDTYYMELLKNEWQKDKKKIMAL
ncbi:MAG: GNAT family protein [Patescibacteria group bacterium]|nr:GNAT family protein [Patescibacteria group bacterium]